MFNMKPDSELNYINFCYIKNVHIALKVYLKASLTPAAGVASSAVFIATDYIRTVLHSEHHNLVDNQFLGFLCTFHESWFC